MCECLVVRVTGEPKNFKLAGSVWVGWREVNEKVNYKNLVVNEQEGSGDEGSGEIDGASDTAMTANMIVTKTWKGEDLLEKKERVEYKEKPRFFGRWSW